MCIPRYVSALLRFWLTAVSAGAVAVGGYAQTVSTGALVGVTLDPSGALLQGVTVTLTNEKTGEKTFSLQIIRQGSVSSC
jgi:hypothetical protein